MPELSVTWYCEPEVNDKVKLPLVQVVGSVTVGVVIVPEPVLVVAADAEPREVS